MVTVTGIRRQSPFPVVAIALREANDNSMIHTSFQSSNLPPLAFRKGGVEQHQYG
jgi:hypothetical protein